MGLNCRQAACEATLRLHPAADVYAAAVQTLAASNLMFAVDIEQAAVYRVVAAHNLWTDVKMPHSIPDDGNLQQPCPD